jgi:hypothetical protein
VSGERRRRVVEIHRLGDNDSMMSDHRVGAAGVTSHDDGVVDRRPGAGAGCRCWYTRGGVSEA